MFEKPVPSQYFVFKFIAIHNSSINIQYLLRKYSRGRESLSEDPCKRNGQIKRQPMTHGLWSDVSESKKKIGCYGVVCESQP